jgi:hypothetical protein
MRFATIQPKMPGSAVIATDLLRSMMRSRRNSKSGRRTHQTPSNPAIAKPCRLLQVRWLIRCAMSQLLLIDRLAGGPGAVSNYEQALADQARLRQQYLEPLQRGPLGKLAETPDTKRAINALFPSNPLPASEGEIRDAVGAVARTRPAVAQQLVRAHAEMVFNEAARDLQGGANAFSGAKFAKVIAGNSQQRANLQAAIEALPNGQERWHGFEQLLDIMSATGTRQPKGSLTAFNALEVSSMSNSGLMDIATKGASPGKWMSFANDTFKAWSLGRNLDQIARILTDPRSGDALRQIVRIPAGSDRALVMAGRIIAQLGAATTEQRTNSDQQPGRNEGRSHAQ